MAKPEDITICLNVLFFNVRFTFLVKLFAGIRILFGRTSETGMIIRIHEIFQTDLSSTV